MPLDQSYWLSDQIRFLKEQVARLGSAPAIQNASANGTAGWLRIFANAISGRPSLDFHYTGGGGDILAQIYQDTGGNIRITGGLQVSGTKNFVMQHPTKTGWILRHASTESPVNGVEYWGESYVEPGGTVVVKLPEYFEALTKKTNRNVSLTAIGLPADLGASRVVNGVFTVTGPAGAEFFWTVKAERASQPEDWSIDFQAEEAGEVPPPPSFRRKPERVPEVTPGKSDTPHPIEVRVNTYDAAEAISAAEAEGMHVPGLYPAPPLSSPMVDESWEKRPDRPQKPTRTTRENDPEFALLMSDPAPADTP